MNGCTRRYCCFMIIIILRNTNCSYKIERLLKTLFYIYIKYIFLWYAAAQIDLMMGFILKDL